MKKKANSKLTAAKSGSVIRKAKAKTAVAKTAKTAPTVKGVRSQKIGPPETWTVRSIDEPKDYNNPPANILVIGPIEDGEFDSSQSQLRSTAGRRLSRIGDVTLLDIRTQRNVACVTIGVTAR